MINPVSYVNLLQDLNLLLSVLAIVPFVINLHYYFRFKNIDHFYLSIYFCLWVFYGPFEIYYYNVLSEQVSDLLNYVLGTMLVSSVNILTIFPLVFVSARAKYNHIPGYIKTFFGLGIIMTLLNWIDNNQFLLFGTTPLLLFFQFVTTITGHSLVVYFFLTTPFVKTNRAIISRRIWIGSSSLWVLALISGIPTFFDPSLWLNPIFVSISFTPFIIAFTGILVNHIFYPEAVLITYEQVIRARKMYQYVIEMEQEEETPQLGIQKIMEYINHLTNEVTLEE